MSALSPLVSVAALALIAAAPVAPLTVGVLAAPVAAAESDGTFLPFSTTLRRCDYSAREYYDAAGEGRATATVRSGSGQVSADVRMTQATPNTFYEVRLIQAPRASAAGCGAGAPGTAVAAMNTDGIGSGAVTLSSPIVAGATGAWLSIERPQPNSALPQEFYTTDFIVGI